MRTSVARHADGANDAGGGEGAKEGEEESAPVGVAPAAEAEGGGDCTAGKGGEHGGEELREPAAAPSMRNDPRRREGEQAGDDAE